MIGQPPRLTLTYTLFPYTTFFRLRAGVVGTMHRARFSADRFGTGVTLRYSARPFLSAATVLIHGRPSLPRIAVSAAPSDPARAMACQASTIWLLSRLASRIA